MNPGVEERLVVPAATAQARKTHRLKPCCFLGIGDSRLFRLPRPISGSEPLSDVIGSTKYSHSWNYRRKYKPDAAGMQSGEENTLNNWKLDYSLKRFNYGIDVFED